MTESPKDKLRSMDTRQKAIAGISAVVFIFLIWQVVGMFGGEEEIVAPTKTTATQAAPGAPPPGMVTQAQFPQQQVSPELQAQIAKLQNETQQRYIVALNQLQLLKLSQQIVDINKEIAASKLNTVKSEKEIVDMLTKPAEPVETARSYSQNLANPFATAGTGTPQIQGVAPPPEMQQQQQQASGDTSAPITVAPEQQQEDTTIANYVVISVSNLLSKWSAVLGYQGRLYSVNIGDVMPIDGATVKSIDKYSVILQKGNSQKKISLVPLI